ncbi:MAG: GspE/PulE family protein [Planctomycetota bacterium]|jgi:type IV pilus assembly protein PilB
MSTTSKFNRRLGKILTQFDLVSEEALGDAMEKVTPQRSLTEVLVEGGTVEEGDILSALARETSFPPIDITKLVADEPLGEYLPEHLAKYYSVVPVAKVGRTLTLAVYDPFDIVKFDDIAMVTSCNVKPVLSTDYRIREAIPEVYNATGRRMEELLDGMGTDPELEISESGVADEELDDLSLEGGDTPVVKIVNHIIYQGIRDRASDIHIEPFDRSVRVRYRMDGVLRESVSPPTKLHSSIVSRIKIMCGLDIAERRVPQDGKFQLRVDGRQVDFRVSTLPTVHGEKVVLRILDASNLALNLDTLGFEEKCLSDIRSAINVPYGMLLVTGPTGSGKSTTLYSCVTEVMRPDDNIVTVEDPVEYQLDGVIQVPVNNKRGMTFAAALRSILRQDPDTVMIGEIRDLETVEIAIKAALTGHLVFSTLHTNDAPSTVTRMIDMGVDPFLVASATQCIAAQRLARRLCNECKRPVEGAATPEHLLELGFLESELEGLELFEAVGCGRCSNGFKGRFAILETLAMTEELRRCVISGGDALEIRDVALSQGMITLRRAALMNAMRGKTSIDEVLRVTRD